MYRILPFQDHPHFKVFGNGLVDGAQSSCKLEIYVGILYQNVGGGFVSIWKVLSHLGS